MSPETPPVYSHTQYGKFVLAFLVPAFLLELWIALMVGFHLIIVVTLLVLAACVLMFGWLTVEVAERVVRLRFGVGSVRKQFPVDQIRAARKVRNKWYYGWGVRWLGHGWLYNVSGLDAVEIEMADGRKHRIGTDEPDALSAAILAARENRNG